MGRSPFLGVIGVTSPGDVRDKSLCQSPLLDLIFEGLELFDGGLQLPAPDIDLDEDVYEEVGTIRTLATKLGGNLPETLGIRTKNTFLDVHQSDLVKERRPRAWTDSNLSSEALTYRDTLPSSRCEKRDAVSTTVSQDSGSEPSADYDVNLDDNQVQDTCIQFVMKPTWCHVDVGENGVVSATAIELGPDECLQDIVEKVERHRPSEKAIGKLLGPLSQYAGVLEWKGSSEISPTTLVLENLPVNMTQADFVEVLDREGFCGLYDFVFLPTDASGLCCGYAVVNVARRVCGEALAKELRGRVHWGEDVACLKPCKVSWSQPLQGLLDNIRVYRNHPLNDDSVLEDCKPQVFAGGFQVPFLQPSFPLSSVTSWNDSKSIYSSIES